MVLGYINAKEAVKRGFTNHGKYYGIPVYIRDDIEFEVTAKWVPLDILIELVTYIEMIIASIFFPEREGFMFLVGPKIEVNENEK